MKKIIGLMVVVLFLFNIVITPTVFGQQAVPVMTLANGTVVKMTPAQLSALAAQPGVAVVPVSPEWLPRISGADMAIPLPSELGGGFIIAEPSALSAGMNAVGITTGATASTVAGATASAGAITAGAGAAGVATTAGISTGTIAAGAVAAAAVAGIAIAAGGGGGGGTTTTHH